MFYIYLIVLITWIAIGIIKWKNKETYKNFDWVMFSEIIWLALLGIATTLK